MEINFIPYCIPIVSPFIPIANYLTIFIIAYNYFKCRWLSIFTAYTNIKFYR